MYDDVTLEGGTCYRVYAFYMTLPIICMYVCMYAALHPDGQHHWRAADPARSQQDGHEGRQRREVLGKS